ncbi:MAG: replicative DNA helicase [Bacteroidetes bacterium]|nr:replicative DNA helicase [Bacteroidota bacterium]
MEAFRHSSSVQVHQLQDSSGRVPPQAIDVEQYVLGSMLMDPKSVSIASSILPADAFYLPKHTAIYEALLDLSNKNQPTDLITVSERLRSQKQLEMIGGIPYLAELTDRISTSANTERHARIIIEKSLLRKVIGSMSKRITEAYDPSTDAFDLLDEAESDLFKISHSQVRRSTQMLKDILQETISHLQTISHRDRLLSGITSGFYDLDKLTGGWQNSDLIIIAGRPSMGKCVDADTPILQSDGQLIRISDLYQHRNAHILTLAEDRRFSITQPSAYLYDGIKPVYRVTTRLGRSVSTTLSHPFLTHQGWQPLGELSLGQSIAVPRELPVFGTHTVPDFDLQQLANTIRNTRKVTWSMPTTRGTAIKARGIQVLPQWAFTLQKECLDLFFFELFPSETSSIVVSSAHLAQQIAHLGLRLGILCQLRERSTGWSVTPHIRVDQTCGHPHHILFDDIVNIECMGDRPVYDLTVDETHNFVASDVCVHNTAFALDCARNASMDRDNPIPTAIFSLEMSSRQLAQRMIMSEARVNAQKARSGTMNDNDFSEVVKAADRFFHSQIFIDDSAGLGVMELRAKCRRLKSEHQIGLVLVDYLQLMQGRSKDNREQEIANISRSLKELAKELDIPVIALSQLNRNAEDRKDRRPQLADLRESGAIEQDADVVAFIYRPEYYGITEDKDRQPTEGKAEIIIGKHRNGPTGNIQLLFRKDFARFENLTREEYFDSDDEDSSPI